MSTNNSRSRVAWILFLVFAGLTAVHIGYVVHHEPFAFDAWNVAVDTDAQGFSLGRFFAFWHREYTSSNPRIGQPLTYFAYKLEGVAEVGTPLAFLSLVVAGFVVGAGRWPRRTGRDLAMLSLGIGLLWIAAPHLPAYMFCRAYATNYLWAAAIQMWFLAAWRLAPTEATLLRTAAMFVLGVVAGMCNEHTGPTLALFVVGSAALAWRAGAVSRARVAAAAGVVIGFALIFFAPGQSQRYEGFVKERLGIFGQIKARGFEGNLDILADLVSAAAPLLVVLFAIVAIALIAERRDDEKAELRSVFVTLVLVVIASVLTTATLFASPKLGVRFFIHPMALLVGAITGAGATLLPTTRRVLVPFVAIAVVIAGVAAMKTIPLYRNLARDSEARLAALAATPLGGRYTAHAWDEVSETWWFLGDDLRDERKRELVAKYFGLREVVHRSNENAIFGASDLSLRLRYTTENDACLDKIETLVLEPYKGRTIPKVEKTFREQVEQIRAVAPVTEIELVPVFEGDPPPLPGKELLAMRWRAGEVEAYAVSVKRAGKRRTLVMPEALTKTPWDMYLLQLGEAPKKLGVSTDKLGYEPWDSGVYWVLACKGDTCFLTFSTMHHVW